jgi:hypothetical protein
VQAAQSFGDHPSAHNSPLAVICRLLHGVKKIRAERHDCNPTCFLRRDVIEHVQDLLKLLRREDVDCCSQAEPGRLTGEIGVRCDPRDPFKLRRSVRDLGLSTSSNSLVIPFLSLNSRRVELINYSLFQPQLIRLDSSGPVLLFTAFLRIKNNLRFTRR